MTIGLFIWLWLVVNDRKFTAETVFFSHTNQPAVLLHEPATIRTSQPNRLYMNCYSRYMECDLIDEKYRELGAKRLF